MMYSDVMGRTQVYLGSEELALLDEVKEDVERSLILSCTHQELLLSFRLRVHAREYSAR